MFPLWRLEYLYKLLVILLQERSVFSPPFLSSIISLYQHRCEDILYFGLHSPILLYCVVQIVPYLAISSSFRKLLSPFDIIPWLWAFFFFRTSWLSGKIRCSRLMLHISCLSPRTSHFPKESYLLLMALETKVWAPRVHTATESGGFQAPLTAWTKNCAWAH